MQIFRFKYLPLILVIGFNLFTLAIFLTAPINWASNNIFTFLVLSLLCQSMLLLGYRRGYKKKKKKHLQKLIFFNFSPSKINLLLRFYSLTFLIKYAYLLKFQFYDIVGMFNFLLIGFVDPQLGYALTFDDSKPTTVSWFIYFLISIINQIFFLIGFIKWKSFTLYWKFAFTFFVILEVFFWLGRGTNFGTISLLITLIFCLVCQVRKNGYEKIPLLKYLFIGLMFFSIGIFAFSNNMSRRGGAVIQDLQYFNIGLSKVDESAPILSIMPDKFKPTYLYIVSYLSQGYYHTSLAFDLDFKPTFFMGNNFAVLSFAKFFGIDLWEDTYVYRLNEKGVDPFVNWHSSYLWFASDVSFFGLPILFYFIGLLFGYAWNLVVNYDDFLSKVIVVIIASTIVFIFANNTYISSVFYSFLFILPLWIFTRMKFSK